MSDPSAHPGRARRIRVAARLAGLLLALVTAQTLAMPNLRIFAAASLTDALNAAVARYESSRAVEIVPVFGASSTAARQIAHGAPADLYLSANRQWMDWLADRGVVLQERADLLHNRLMLVAATGSGIDDYRPGAARRPLAALLPDDDRIALGDPAHVPAGIYARHALRSLGQWHTLADRLARTDDVRAALALVERGEVPLGIVYRSDARAAENIVPLGLFPADSHPPIAYPLALVGPSPSAAARDFRTWLAGEEALAIFAAHGFQSIGD